MENLQFTSFIIGLIIGISATYGLLNFFDRRERRPTDDTVNGLRPLPEALEMIEAFRSKNKNGKTSLSGHLDWNDFNNYIAYLKRLAKDKKATLHGLQYYFSTYTESTAIDAEHKGYNTIVFFPSIKDGKKVKVVDLETGTDIDKSIKQENVQNLNITNTIMALSDESLSTAYNKSQLSPPRGSGGQ